jgi:uncharacterized protein YcfJ
MNSKILSVSAVVLALSSQLALADHGHDSGRGYGRNNGYEGGYRDDRGYRNDRGYRDGGYDNDYDYARVLNVEPLMERVRYSVPVEQCWNEESRDDYRGGYRRSYGNSSSAGAAVLGGVAGAAIGNHIGRGDDRVVATIAGAVLGAAIGNQVGSQRRDDYGYSDYRGDRGRSVERCQTRNEERYDERVRGYRVTYEYNGRRSVTEMPYDPGRRLRVAVNVHPTR